MRLLTRDENGELRLETVDDNVPAYAILSHTWNEDAAEEVTFADILNRDGRGKAGYCKVEFCLEQAQRDGLRYCWIDTCCIDKSMGQELQASINSMFQWYSNAARCYVYMSDVSKSQEQQDHLWKTSFQKSRWMARGWTLQELLAPASVEFFSRERVRLGDKTSLEQLIHEPTRIPITALRGQPLSQFTVDERFSWAETRSTTLVEDEAYCLQGIFGVFLPLLYGEGKDNAVRRLRKEIESTPQRQEWLRKLYVCPYRDSKDRNPPRVKGTCEWFTRHALFRNWQQSTAAGLLWVSADPGCGKSVLSKYLVDEVLPSTVSRTTCYFFFKEDFEDQRSSVTALCSMLHQIFEQHPTSFSTQILDMLQDRGDKLLTSFRDLWDVFIAVTTYSSKREITCIFDALDECEVLGRRQLIEAASKFYSGKTAPSTLKVLFTSRPYLDIRRAFYTVTQYLPTIHLSGESEEEVDKISHEIDLVVRSKVVDIGDSLGLLEEEQQLLQEELTRAPNRTYMWVHLVFDLLVNSIVDGLEDIPLIVKATPKTVDAAYDRILSKSPDIERAKRLLHIIVAATRPLTLQEIALASAIKPHHRSISDLRLGPEDRIQLNIRQYCGLFVTVIDSKVYLLHQTAREFLVSPLIHSATSPLLDKALQWKHSLHPKESSRILAEICMLRLSMSDFSLHDLERSPNKDQYITEHALLGYAAYFWTRHFRESDWEKSDWLVKKALTYFNPEFSESMVWFKVYQALATGHRPRRFMPLLVACYFGVDIVVERLLEDGAEVNVKDESEFTPLYWASVNGQDAVVQQLLFKTSTDVNTHCGEYGNALHAASGEGHETVVGLLLRNGADVNAQGGEYRTALNVASVRNFDAIVRLLLEMGADVHAHGNEHALNLAAARGYEMIVRLLIERGADINFVVSGYGTALNVASARGYETIVQLLLEAGADVDAESGFYGSALQAANAGGHINIVRLLEKKSAYCIPSSELINSEENLVAVASSMKARSATGQLRGRREPGAVGLSNLGNIGYMNSVVQCMRSVSKFTKYFLTGKHTKDINKHNSLGYEGRMALAYGSLLKDMYSTAKDTISPVEFRRTVGRCHSMFANYNPQDALEFLEFLLDALSEDLNRVGKRQYIEMPVSTDEMIHDEAAAAVMANKVWDITMKQSNSIISDIFMGLYKSTFNCPVCHKISITFDAFRVLRLPLPEEPWVKRIKFYPLDDSPVEIEVETPRQGCFHNLKQFISERTGVAVERLIGAEEWKGQLYKIYNDNDILTEIGRSDVTAVHELEGTPSNWPPKQQQKASSGVEAKFADRLTARAEISECVETSFHDERYDCMVVPVLHRRYTEQVLAKDLHSHNFIPPHFIVLNREEARIEAVIWQKIVEKVSTFTTWHGFLNDDGYTTGTANTETTYTAEAESVNAVATVANVPTAQGAGNNVHTSRNAVAKTTPETIVPSSPPLNLPKIFNKRSGRWVKTDSFYDPKFRNMFNLSYFSTNLDDHEFSTGWITIDNNKAYPRLSERSDHQFLPTTYVTSQDRVAGTVFKQEHNPLIRLGEGIVIDWTENAWDDLFNLNSTEDPNRGANTYTHLTKLHDPILEQRRKQQKSFRAAGVPLSDCLDAFQQIKILPEYDMWYCSRCKEHRRASKKIDLWKTPDILVFNLDRFSRTGKVNIKVNFPVAGVDLAQWVLKQEDGKAEVYDLISVIEHFGDIKRGHYTASAKNLINGRWYHYDDGIVEMLDNPETVVRVAASTLFYRRRSAFTST